ncbi:diacylglycerol kinase family protein [Cohnella sp. GCM10027633]|uniref:diacylglycerol kinase family protein n=1 Tax=unclassified Cohnella TaxID=2636738 RepID=UPI00363C826F
MSDWRTREARSFGYAIRGIVEAVRRERHMRFHVAAAVVVIAVAAWLQADTADWLWLVAAIGSVWAAELFNTAIERAVDLASPDLHPLAKAAKDAASGAVLVAAAFAAVIGVIVLGPPLWERLIG